MRRLRRSQYYEYRSPQVINVLFFSKEKKTKTDEISNVLD